MREPSLGEQAARAFDLLAVGSGGRRGGEELEDEECMNRSRSANAWAASEAAQAG